MAIQGTRRDFADGALVQRVIAEQVDNSQLGDFLAELSRHRPGILRCDPSVAGLELTGVFPLADTDRVLAALQQSLPVQVHSLTRYWISVSAKPNKR